MVFETSVDGLAHLAPEVVHREVARVDDDVGGRPQRLEHLALLRDPVGEPAVALDGVRASHGLVAPHEHLVGRVEEHHAIVDLELLHLGEDRLEIVEELPPADVDDGGEARERVARMGRHLDERQQHLGRKVVDDVPSEVLELGGRT